MNEIDEIDPAPKNMNIPLPAPQSSTLLLCILDLIHHALQ